MSTLLSPIREFFRKGDVLLLSLCLIASGFGLLLIFSATRWEHNNRAVIIQLIGICLGVVAYVVLTFVDFELFTEKNWKLLFFGGVALILLILTPLGVEIYGNRNWLHIPGFPMNLQPNEIVKIPFILLLALQISKIQSQGRDISSIPSVLQIGGYTVFMLGLIAAICGDMGTCMVYIIIFATMAWVSGVKLRWFLIVGGGIVAAAMILWLFILPDTSLWDSNYIIMRFRVVLDHDLDPLDKGFQQSRSILAIGSGRLFGQGYLQGIQTQANYDGALPARDTDFIFAVCGEEFGLVGCTLLLLILAILALSGVFRPEQKADLTAGGSSEAGITESQASGTSGGSEPDDMDSTLPPEESQASSDAERQEAVSSPSSGTSQSGSDSSRPGSGQNSAASGSGSSKPSGGSAGSSHQHTWKAHQVWVENIVTVVDTPEQTVRGAQLYTEHADGQWVSDGEIYWFENGFTMEDLKAIIKNKIKNENYIGNYVNRTKTIPAVTHEEDHGSYQTDYYYCACGATKRA